MSGRILPIRFRQYTGQCRCRFLRVSISDRDNPIDQNMVPYVSPFLAESSLAVWSSVQSKFQNGILFLNRDLADAVARCPGVQAIYGVYIHALRPCKSFTKQRFIPLSVGMSRAHAQAASEVGQCVHNKLTFTGCCTLMSKIACRSRCSVPIQLGRSSCCAAGGSEYNGSQRGTESMFCNQYTAE